MTADPHRENQKARRGSVGRDASGRWFYVYDREPVNGKRRQVRRRGFDTRAEARAAMAEAKVAGRRLGSEEFGHQT